MTYYLFLLMVVAVVGMIGVASNPTPYFAAFGLVVVAGAGCGMLLSCGGPFLSLVLFLIYLGGMLVVFAYSAALSAEPFPEAWGGRFVAWRVFIYGVVATLLCGILVGGWYEGSLVVMDLLESLSLLRGDMGGVVMMYSFGGKLLILCVWVLLLTLFVVLEVTRGLSYGVLRAI
uniref:NADH-ubiquinone oxidoreductase chain 6 n=1 Tax=Danionella dracula TaxID=623740 RepID=A0A1Q2TBD0_9TELE|nr:NADH dehydrogenase subunit 6 [Danionella dracula]